MENSQSILRGGDEGLVTLAEQAERGAVSPMSRLAIEQTMTEDVAEMVAVEAIDGGRLTEEKHSWPGSVSARTMVAEGITSEKIIDEAVANINNYYVDVNPGARTRCIDGRHDPELNEANLGPQVPGGAPGAALAYRLGVDKDDLTRGTFVTDADAMIGSFMRLGFPPGGHRDEHSSGETTVGCGAIDGMDVILATMTDYDLVDDHKRVVKQLLGSQFDRDTYLRIMGAAVVVNGRSKDYFRDRGAVIDILEQKAPETVATLKGHHQECVVAVNMVDNTTLASNRFADTYDGIQAFGYDLWRSKEMAIKLLPRPDQAIDRERFVMARVMTTVATLMALTDGSQRLVLRMQTGAEI